MDFYTNFKRICTEKGTSPTRVCKELGYSTSKVNLWHNGSLPKQDVIATLAEHLQCSVTDFFDNGVETTPTDDALYTLLDEDEKDLIRIFRSLSRRDRHAFMAVAYGYENKSAQ